jgi:hypothetical protein
MGDTPHDPYVRGKQTEVVFLHAIGCTPFVMSHAPSLHQVPMAKVLIIRCLGSS